MDTNIPYSWNAFSEVELQAGVLFESICIYILDIRMLQLCIRARCSFSEVSLWVVPIKMISTDFHLVGGYVLYGMDILPNISETSTWSIVHSKGGVAPTERFRWVIQIGFKVNQQLLGIP